MGATPSSYSAVLSQSVDGAAAASLATHILDPHWVSTHVQTQTRAPSAGSSSGSGSEGPEGASGPRPCLGDEDVELFLSPRAQVAARASCAEGHQRVAAGLLPQGLADVHAQRWIAQLHTELARSCVPVRQGGRRV
jgi:hypothetical protein